MTRKVKTTRAPALLLATLAALPIALSGCAAISGPGDGIVFVGGRKLGKSIEVADLKSTTTETGTRKVWTTIRNKTKVPVALEARAVFRGDQGQPIEPEPGWRQVFVQPNTSIAFDGLSMSRDAQQAFLEIRAGNK